MTYLSFYHVVEFLTEVRNQHFCNTIMWNSFALVYKCFRQILAPILYDVILLGELWLVVSVDVDQSESTLDWGLQKTDFYHRKRRGRNSWWQLKIAFRGIWRQCPMTSSPLDELWLVNTEGIGQSELAVNQALYMKEEKDMKTIESYVRCKTCSASSIEKM